MEASSGRPATREKGGACGGEERPSRPREPGRGRGGDQAPRHHGASRTALRPSAARARFGRVLKPCAGAPAPTKHTNQKALRRPRVSTPLFETRTGTAITPQRKLPE